MENEISEGTQHKKQQERALLQAHYKQDTFSCLVILQ